MNNIYEIKLKINSPISFMMQELPCFDSIIAFCVYQDNKIKSDFHTPHGNEVIDYPLPIEKHESGIYLSSMMMFDEFVESCDSWKKRWENRFDHISDFGKAKRRVHTGSGKYKSYNMPVVINSIGEVSFVFKGNKKEVERLINKHLYGIGKKVNTGFGWFDSFEIKECKKSKQYLIYYRPLNKEFVDHKDFMKVFPFKFKKIRKTYGGFYPPYWKFENMGNIFIPEI